MVRRRVRAASDEKSDGPFYAYGTGGKGKKERLERQMGPWFENGTVRISDADTPFLNALRKEMDDYPHGTMDCMDSVYWALRQMPDILIIKAEPDRLPSRMKKTRKGHPMLSLGRV